MTTISGPAYLVIGIGIAIISAIVNLTTGNKSMTLFFIIGVIFILIGIIKLLRNRQKQPKIHSHRQQMHHVPPQQAHHHHMQQTQHPAQQAMQNQQHLHPQHTQHHHMFPQHKICPRCHTKNPTHVRFCHHCGSPFR